MREICASALIEIFYDPNRWWICCMLLGAYINEIYICIGMLRNVYLI